MLASHNHVFTSESVTEGHPDKVCDQISDAVLDTMLAQDAASRVACETLVTTGMVLVAGEVTTTATVDVPALVRDTIRSIGYTDASHGFDYATCAVLMTLDRQSPDIALGVDTGGAGDQGMMFGYATDETPSYMPLPVVLAHRMAERLSDVRKSGEIGWLRPDGKTQVSVEYEGDRPIRVTTVVISTQHDDAVSQAEIKNTMIEAVARPILQQEEMDADGIEFLINPTGRFVVGGPHGDAGLTGRKIIVDTYGGMARHGGGAFSGKDPSKVDRSAAYATRWVAKHIVAAGLAKRCEVQVAYAIGCPAPVSVMVQTFGTGTAPEPVLEGAVREVFDLTPRSIIEALHLRRPIYRPTAAYGHFGRTPESRDVYDQSVDLFTWERTERVDELREAVEKAASGQSA